MAMISRFGEILPGRWPAFRSPGRRVFFKFVLVDGIGLGLNGTGLDIARPCSKPPFANLAFISACDR